MAAVQGIEQVAIVDDDLVAASVMAELLRDAGFEPVEIQSSFNDIERFIGQVSQSAQAAVCDHRLRRMQLASFDGAEAVASLFDKQIPAILVTQYINTDADVTIRRWRDRVPVLMSRHEASDPARIREGLETCAREIQGEYSVDRQPWRALVEVEEVTFDSGQPVVDARVHQWRPDEVVRFPLALVPAEIRPSVTSGSFLLANVNIGAEIGRDLFFADIHPAPEPIPESSLG
jgi:CheY-like chemotaxis protein